MAFTENESYKHKKAKEVLKEWFYGGNGMKNIGFTPNRECGVFLEYPIVTNVFEEHDFNGTKSLVEINSINMNWDEIEGCWDEFTPTYKYCCDKNWRPKRVIDVVLPHKGRPEYFIEVCHTNPVSKEKIKQLADLGVHNLLEVDAEWVLRQTKRPDELKCKVLIDICGNYEGDELEEKDELEELKLEITSLKKQLEKMANITVEDYNAVVERAYELETENKQRGQMIQTLVKQTKHLNARLDAIKLACSGGVPEEYKEYR